MKRTYNVIFDQREKINESLQIRNLIINKPITAERDNHYMYIQRYTALVRDIDSKNYC